VLLKYYYYYNNYCTRRRGAKKFPVVDFCVYNLRAVDVLNTIHDNNNIFGK